MTVKGFTHFGRLLVAGVAFVWALLPQAHAAAADLRFHIDGSSLANGVVSATWRVTDHRLRSVIIEDRDTGARLDAGRLVLLEFQGGGVIWPAMLDLVGEPTVEPLTADPAAASAAERTPGLAVHFRMADPRGRLRIDYALIARDGASYVREAVTLTAGDEDAALGRIGLIDVDAPGIAVAGSVKGSPLTAGDFFLGFEHPLSMASVTGGHASAVLDRGVPLSAGQSVRYSAVFGVSPGGDQMRRAFLAYVERERAHPYRTFLHYNSWYDIGFFTPYSQADALDRIEAFGRELHDKRGVTLDSYLFDDGWDDRTRLWRIRDDFKDGFRPLTAAAARYGAAPGVWLSPWGGYGQPKKDRIAAGRKDGYEIVDGGFALSGPRYYARFREACLEMIRVYGVNQFKLDGTGNADQVVKGSAFDSDFDAAIHLIGDLRREKPDLYVNLTTGTYPSPFWLLYADSIWRGAEDDGFAGAGPWRERWITYRDAVVHDQIVEAGPLFPLNALMLHGLIYARKAEHLADDPEHRFQHEVRDYFGTGTQLQEMYITPALLSSDDWDVLAEAAKWSRANAAVLKDTHWVGGDPRWGEIYGWAAWSPAKGILTLRNPSDAAREITLDIGRAFQLPLGAPERFMVSSPWRDEAATPPLHLLAGKPQVFHLAPFQVLTLEAKPE
jgi:hypothetical protein